MVKFLYKSLLTINMIILLPICYLIKNKIWINIIDNYSLLLYILLPLLLTYVSIKISYFCENDCIKGGMKKISVEDNNKPLLNQIYYIMLALIIPNPTILIYTFIFLFLLNFKLITFYNNPLITLFGYNIYYIKNQTDIKICVISKQNIRNIKVLSFDNLKRINNYTFIDWSDKK